VGEVYTLRLQAELVGLSACQTGLGAIHEGDEIVGFVRAFFYAGADSILSSLWSVEDLATRDLMVAFYENLKTKGKREALREAELKVKEQYPHPFYWAAFRLTGAAQ
jgi:CHAT domain-containing protein